MGFGVWGSGCRVFLKRILPFGDRIGAPVCAFVLSHFTSASLSLSLSLSASLSLSLSLFAPLSLSGAKRERGEEREREAERERERERDSYRESRGGSLQCG